MSEKSQPALRNLSSAQLVEFALRGNEGVLADTGALVVLTGKRTGRSPADRFLVRSPQVASHIEWGARNNPVDEDTFESLWSRAGNYMAGRQCFAADLHVGQHEDLYLPLEVTTDTAWQLLFARNMFIRPTEFNPENKPCWQLRSATGLLCDPQRDHVNSDGAVMIDLAGRRVLLAGMRYAGEMKKAMFTVQNYLLPERGVLPMHCAANVDARGDTTLFFGLSGTGKTTLSADPDCELIGDDEHGWGDGSVFNLEGGCYAKCVNLSRDNEPVIWDAITFGTILENVAMHSDTRRVDYSDVTITENSRCSYPRDHIKLRCQSNRAGEPRAIIFLTCDVSSVLPPLSILSREAAAYHFLSGYTAKVASTELGSVEGVQPTFSTCFGAPFFPRPPSVYADLLMKRMDAYDSRVYLLNTGWTGGPGGPKGTGKRFPIPLTRAIVHAIQSGQLRDVETRHLDALNLDIPVAIPGVDSTLLDPRETWQDPAAYDAVRAKLVSDFAANFEKFEVAPEISAAGPRGAA